MSEIEPRAAAAAAMTPQAGDPLPERPTLGRGLTVAIVCAVAVGALGLLYVIGSSLNKPGAGGSLQSLAQGSMSKLQALAAPTPEPSTAFVDASGQPVRLSAFHGQAVVLNLWATWCAPCKTEMPTLATLQSAYAGKPLKVVAVSLDEAAQSDAAKAFIATHAPLGFYQDARHGFLSDLQPHLMGFPTTVLIDRSGQERAIMMGDADWSTPQARKVVDRLMAL